MMFALSYRMLGNYEDAEDVAQESLVRAIRALDRWDPTRPMKPWLLTITANRCRTALMKRTKKPPPSHYPREPGAIDQNPGRLDLAEELDRALQELQPDHRECFLLFHEHDLNCAEVGEVLGHPEGTIKTWLHRTRKKLAEILRQRGVVPEISYELP
ncbi:MAG: RNA polymerase sigma factor [Planctomycetaceae bacterium]|nr:RNA polymerase sigma factor [Planctomycetaceae bacterium]